MFEFLDSHIVAYGDVLISHHLLEPIPSQVLAPQKSHGTIVKKRGFERRVGRIYIGTREGSINLRDHKFSSRSSMVKNHDRSGGWRLKVKFLLLITSIARKVTHVQFLRHSLPLFLRDQRDELQYEQSRWTSLDRNLVPKLDNLITNNAFHLILLHSCHSYTKERELSKSRQTNKQKCKRINNLHRWVISSWVNASSVRSGPSPQVARRQSIIKEWKVLPTKERARWMRSREKLVREGRLTAKKKN